MSKEKTDFEFRCINPADFELVFKLTAKKKIFDLIFKRTKEKLMEKDITYDEKKVDYFKVDPLYNKLIATSMIKLVKDVSKQTKKQGIMLMSSNLKEANFRKLGDGSWNIEVIYTGTYVDKR